MSNQNTKEGSGIEFVLFSCTEDIGIDKFGYLNSSLYLYLFCNEPTKKNMVYVLLHLTFTYSEPPPPHTHTRTSTLLAGPPLPLPSIYILWMTPYSFLIFLVEIFIFQVTNSRKSAFPKRFTITKFFKISQNLQNLMASKSFPCGLFHDGSSNHDF